jgi:hypothetical protein
MDDLWLILSQSSYLDLQLCPLKVEFLLKKFNAEKCLGFDWLIHLEGEAGFGDGVLYRLSTEMPF